MNDRHAFFIVLVVAAVTFFTRACPFLLFRGNRKIPKTVKYLGGVLPPAIMAILVVYCLKTVQIFSYPFGLPEIISISVVGIVHLWKRNNLLSIGLGTLTYMLLIQYVFV